MLKCTKVPNIQTQLPKQSERPYSIVFVKHNSIVSKQELHLGTAEAVCANCGLASDSITFQSTPNCLPNTWT